MNVTGFAQTVRAGGVTLVVITHEPLPGLMGSMTMGFRAVDGVALNGLASGDRVEFTVQEQDKDLRLVELRKVQGS